MRHSTSLRLLLLVTSTGLTASLMLGCGGGDDRPKVARVSGKVTYKGQPVGKGAVTFTPTDGTLKGAQPANGTLGPDGSYQLTTYNDGDGAIVGEHTVTVMSQEDDPLASGAGMPTPDQIAKAKKPKSFIPEKFGDPTKSGLRFKVEDKANTIDIPLD